MRSWLAIGIILCWIGMVTSAWADGDSGKYEGPWKTFSFNAGAFISATDTGVRIGSGLGVDIDFEDLLGLDTENTVFRIDAYWRFTDNHRHRLDFSWFSLYRSGNRQIAEDINIELPDDSVINIPAETQVKSFFDLDIYQINYSYSFFQDDRLDLAVAGGLYLMPIGFGISATGLVEEEGDAKFTAPLPVIGLRADVAITDKWYFRTGTQIFYLQYNQFTGSLLSLRSAVEYNPWKYFGFGLGFDAFRMQLEADGQDYPEIDFKGTVNFDYTGLQIYARVFF